MPLSHLTWLTNDRVLYGVSSVHLHGRYAYVTNGAHRARNRRTHVIDLRTGRRLRVLPFSRLPHLLTLSP